MSKEEFKRRWELNDEGDGITLDEVADCAVKWNLYSTPKTKPVNEVIAAVLSAAGVTQLDL